MTREDQHIDLKSLRVINARNVDWHSLAQDCVCFANGSDDQLLSQGHPAPVPEEGSDWVKVTNQRRIAKQEVMHLLTEADARFQLTQRERIMLGVLAQSEGLTARDTAWRLKNDVLSFGSNAPESIGCFGFFEPNSRVVCA